MRPGQGQAPAVGADALQHADLVAVGAVPVSGETRLVAQSLGAKVVTAIEEALALGPGTLDAEREVLRIAGNMSAPTVLFVLSEVLARRPQGVGQVGVLTAEHTGLLAQFAQAGVMADTAMRARAQAEMLIDQVIHHLQGFGPEADLLRAIARFAIERDR